MNTWNCPITFLVLKNVCNFPDAGWSKVGLTLNWENSRLLCYLIFVPYLYRDQCPSQTIQLNRTSQVTYWLLYVSLSVVFFHQPSWSRCCSWAPWDEVVDCIVLGSYPVLEITIQSTVFPMRIPTPHATVAYLLKMKRKMMTIPSSGWERAQVQAGNWESSWVKM